MRIELRDGQWAELRERINHGEKKMLMRAVQAGQRDESLIFDYETVLVRVFLRAWSVKDIDGNPIDLADGDAIERTPADIFDELSDAAERLYLEATVPNGSTPPQSGASSSTASSTRRR
jgi:hypothetical protein